MSKPFYMDIVGFDAIQKRLQSASVRIKSEVKEEIKDGAQQITLKAKRIVSKKSFDQGVLAGGIKTLVAGDLAYDVVSLASHSPFIEWGTRKQVRVPAKYADYAAQFRGLKTGSAKEALFAITAWVKRKGFTFPDKNGKQMTLEQTAYIIFHSIMVNGIKARPFLFPTFEAQEPIILKNIQTVLGDII